MKTCLLSFFLIFNIIFTFSTQAFASSGHYSINSSSPLGEDYTDLRFLKDVLSDAEIVGIGEGTHGTKEFFEIKHRIFKFLVEELDFKAFAIEQSMTDMELVNKYIQGEDLDIDKILKENLAIVWQNEEIKNLFVWAREYNQNCNLESEKIRFYGFDIAEYNNYAGEIAKEFYKNVDSKKFDEFFKLFDVNDIYNLDFYKTIMNDLTFNKEQYTKLTSNLEFERTYNLIKNKYEFSEDINFERDRDVCMANNIEWIKTFEEKEFDNNKMMVWAHNGHVGKNQTYTMGAELDKKFGNKYFTIGQLFYSGSFVANFGDLSSYNLIKSQEGTINTAIYNKYKGSDISFLNFEELVQDKEMNEILTQGKYMNEYDAGPVNSGEKKLVRAPLIEEYDALIFFETTTAATYLNHVPKPPVDIVF